MCHRVIASASQPFNGDGTRNVLDVILIITNYRTSNIAPLIPEVGP